MNRVGAVELAPRSDDTVALVELAKQDVEVVRARALIRASNAMLASTCLLLVLVLALVVTVGVSLSSLNETLRDISAQIGPQAVSSAVASVQQALDNTVGTTQNFFALSSSADEMGLQLLAALNESTAILDKTNRLAGDLLQHPTISMALGSATATNGGR